MSHNRPIKVVHLASGDRWAGAEVQLYTLLTQLQSMPDITPIAILMNEGELAERLRARQIIVAVLDESRLRPFQILTGLIRLLRRYRPDTLHTHRQKENILGTLANLLSVRARSVRTVHGARENEPRSLPARLIHILDLWTGNHLQQRVIAVSDDLADKLRPAFITDHIAVIENGVDINAVQAAVTTADFRQAQPDAHHIGIVGRLDPVKRVDIFLETAALLLREQPERQWCFHVFGEGALEGILKAQAARLGLETAVTFHGQRHDIASCLAALDAVIMCSDHEGLPMTVLETLAVGTPMLAHAVGGLRDVLQGGAGGVLVDEHSPKGYATQLITLLEGDLPTVKTRGLARLRERYSAEANATEVAALYRSLLTPQ